VAFPTLPTLPDLPARVDPDGWLSTFDQQMDLRHVGHDGCVDVDLQTYSINSQMAKRAVHMPGGCSWEAFCGLA